MVHNPLNLYEICIRVAVQDCNSANKFNKKEFRALPSNVLFDFYYQMLLEKRLCLLAVEFIDLDVFNRMISMKHNRVKLLKSFQSLIDHRSSMPEDVYQAFLRYDKCKNDLVLIDFGLKLGGFLNEGGWLNYSIKFLNRTEELCKTQQKEDVQILMRLLDCYHKKIYAEVIYCEFEAAEKTFQATLKVIDKLADLKCSPNLAAIYSHFSQLFFNRSEYHEAFNWAKKALKLLHEDLPQRVIIEVLRQASKSCVVKRRFNEAGLLIRQAVTLASNLYEIDNHPHYSDTLLNYGFYLLNFDSIQESVRIYEKALTIRKEIFEKNNIQVAIGLEDMAYALYVNEYSSGHFYSAKENAERSIRIMEKILPKDHFMLASIKRVEALILEEIALDLREGNDSNSQEEYLIKAEALHKSALALSLKAFGEKNVQTAKHYGNLGRLYQSMKKFDEAEAMHLRAIAIKEELLGKEDYEVGLSIGHLASLYNYHMERHQDAEKLYMRSIEINLNLFGGAYSGLEYDYRGLMMVYRKLKDTDKMLHYTYKMREWKNLRMNIKPVPAINELMPLQDLLDLFFSNN